MERKLRKYLSWRAQLARIESSNKRNDPADTNKDTQRPSAVSPALQKKDQEKEKRATSRRRVRGGAPEAPRSSGLGVTSTPVEEDAVNEATAMAEL